MAGATALFCSGLLAQEPNFADPHRFERAVTIGTSTDSYPFSYLGEHTQCEGFAVDLLDATARTMSLKIRRVQAPASKLMETEVVFE